MSFTMASFNAYGIVVSADRCLLGSIPNGEKFPSTTSCQKLFLSTQGYAITFAGRAVVGTIPTPAIIRRVLGKITSDLSLRDFFGQFLDEMSSLTPEDENIVFIAAGYNGETAQIMTASTSNTEIRTGDDLMYTGETDIAQTVICAMKIAYNQMTLQDRMDFHRFVTSTISGMQHYSGQIPTVSEECDIVVLGPNGVLFSSFSKLH